MSKKIEDFVPPLTLCKLIPAGKFENSVLGYTPAGIVVLSETFPVKWFAPTLEEIMGEMAKNPRYFNNGYCEIDGDGFIVGAHLPNLGKPGSTLVEYRDKNGATAALKLFLHDRRKK